MPDPTDHSKDEMLRQFFKKFNVFMVTCWRLGLGRGADLWPKVGGRILVIAHRGRKTGLRRLTPVNYAIVAGEIYCTAGFGAISDWYRNILANPQVEIWLPDSRWLGVAEEVSDHPQRLELMRQVLIGSGVVAPLMGIYPERLSTAELEEITRDYRLVRLRRTQPATGPGGPGDLVYLWIPILALLAGRFIRKNRCRRS